jgi:hypothetical protein
LKGCPKLEKSAGTGKEKGTKNGMRNAKSGKHITYFPLYIFN